MSEEARQLVGWLERADNRRLVRLADLRPSVIDSLPLCDKLGRKQPRQMGGLTYSTLSAVVGVKPKQVPGDFWMLTLTDDGFPSAEVSCTCGATPNVEALAPMVSCECPRAFFFDGENVWAYNSPDKDGNWPEPDAAT